MGSGTCSMRLHGGDDMQCCPRFITVIPGPIEAHVVKVHPQLQAIA
ncbi:hypothetical protein F444_03354 [Phytophthora nicotianae P1976]|uniref:Uncharacterized protein n=1 Tax=Phytophthora nicotianae P1976 TaxID=1317066 RepID=A0A081AUE6_PHYNI|nr:hypothetical protein F444_03354 [Phytophthora nicotianae P1976]